MEKQAMVNPRPKSVNSEEVEEGIKTAQGLLEEHSISDAVTIFNSLREAFTQILMERLQAEEHLVETTKEALARL